MSRLLYTKQYTAKLLIKLPLSSFEVASQYLLCCVPPRGSKIRVLLLARFRRCTTAFHEPVPQLQRVNLASRATLLEYLRGYSKIKIDHGCCQRGSAAAVAILNTMFLFVLFFYFYWDLGLICSLF